MTGFDFNVWIYKEAFFLFPFFVAIRIICFYFIYKSEVWRNHEVIK